MTSGGVLRCRAHTRSRFMESGGVWRCMMEVYGNVEPT